ncbi:MAG: sigma-70 family RNA polymerase sigma factor [Lachnospiraceae bacterium]|jgi:RNA polymerase sigma factor (sigma-70 family)|nr:sigma-70 family RNA polymerase sigma factor [Lachnospiraceae bacterium]MCI9099996.1 sigma-70 family RNA polymerase sigma factor [Lachnospiraceae bacterium]MCI9356903.1 sigma-70 family RNA polymerase sigma factor [Lachnospiraceae bacterium]
MQELVEKAVRGDADAFLELMEMNSLSMYKTARGILKNDNDVSDAIQDTILTSFEKIHKLKNPQYFKTWLIRILINECNQILRHYKKVNTIEQVPETPRQDKSLAEFEFKEMLEQVDEKYRVILVLYYEQGFKISEIAELLELNENTVKTRLARAREQIRSAYFQEDTGKKDKSIGRERSSDEKTNQFSNRREYTAG